MQKNRNRGRSTLYRAGYALLCCAALLLSGGVSWRLVAGQRAGTHATETMGASDGQAAAYIRWVEFSVPLETLEQALRYDLESHDGDNPLNWIELMAYAAAKNGGNFKKNKPSPEIDALVKRLRAGERLEEITADMRYYAYYLEAYTAVLAEFVGEYEIPGQAEPGYGLKAYSPIAKGFGFGHYDDFGNPRSYGYKRLHLGNDLMGAIGAPIIAVEGGTVAALGWNEYGGWRVGIRSDDGRRYYYYAHMRKDSPYAAGLSEGDTVRAGDVIGYMGMTGYSAKENVDNINVPHLHFGMQLIFDESQLEGDNQIWIDVYDLVRLLERRRMPVQKLAEGGYARDDGLYESGLAR